ncbi:MAG: cytochrome C oxidase subunit IV family protein [Acidilobaceae archaeon]
MVEFKATIKLYTIVYLILVGGAIVEIVFILNGIAKWPELFVLGVSGIQASLIILFYMHIFSEPTSIRAMSLITLLLLMVLVSSAVASVMACTPYIVR